MYLYCKKKKKDNKMRHEGLKPDMKLELEAFMMKYFISGADFVEGSIESNKSVI